MASAEQPPMGFKVRHTLRGHTSVVRHIAWSNDGSKMATVSLDRALRLWDCTSGELLNVLVLEDKELQHHLNRRAGLSCVAWSPDNQVVIAGTTIGYLIIWDTQGKNYHVLRSEDRGNRRPSDTQLGLLGRPALEPWIKSVAVSPIGDVFASGSEDQQVRIWDARSLALIDTCTGHRGDVVGLKWSEDSSVLSSGSSDGRVFQWQYGSPPRSNLLHGHSGIIEDIEWSPDGRVLATASWDQTVRIWSPAKGVCEAVLESHTDKILCVSFSSHGHLLASMSMDGTVQIWRSDGWKPLGPLRIRSAIRSRSHCLAFHPSSPVLATLGESGTDVQIWDLDLKILLDQVSAEPTVHYTNAKVVLLGGTSTGKTCLARALMGEPFEPQESTHGMKVWNFHSETAKQDDGGQITRETLLWDLAGQVDYQVVHQLFLDETALAVLMFDPTHPENPFAGVGHWEKALARVAGEDCPRLLVAGRVDRGHPTATPKDIEAFREQHRYWQFIATSAKTGQGVEELREAIRRVIRWERLPVTSSPELWKQIREYLIERRVGDEVLTRRTDLREAFHQRHKRAEFTDAEFDTVIGHAQAQGLMWRLSFGDFVLLKPELLNDYAAAIVRAARRQSEGLGCVAEHNVLEAAIDFEDLERLEGKETEQSLLHAVVQLLIDRELALRESGQLVFPSKFNRQRPEIPEPQPREVAYRFAGSVEELYATLVVRLFYCGAFTLKNLWKNAAEFHDALDNLCGFTLDSSAEGEGVISVFFDKDTPDSSKVLFLRFIHEHLQQRSLADSVRRERIYRCPEYGEEVQNRRAVEVRLSKGKTTIPCQFCDESIDLVDLLETKFANPELLQQIRELEAEVADKKSQAVGVTVAEAKQSVGEYDVFLAHSSADKPQVESIGQALRRRGLNPWLDKEQIPPGRWFQDVIQQAIRDVKSAAIFIGPRGLGRWQAVELRSFISQCVDRNVPVIPVLLPGVGQLPEELVFLREFNWVRFTESVNEIEALDSLEWGITGQHPIGGRE